MANVARLLVKGVTYSVITPTPGAASFTVPLDYTDHRAYLHVDNGASEICRVHVNAGDGLRADLGDMDVDIAVGKSAAIPMEDSARFAVMTTKSVSVQLLDTADTDLTETPLALIKAVLIQG
jgi:hypothetical protein